MNYKDNFFIKYNKLVQLLPGAYHNPDSHLYAEFLNRCVSLGLALAESDFEVAEEELGWLISFCKKYDARYKEMVISYMERELRNE